jgi:hypothetical protein
VGTGIVDGESLCSQATFQICFLGSASTILPMILQAKFSMRSQGCVCLSRLSLWVAGLPCLCTCIACAVCTTVTPVPCHTEWQPVLDPAALPGSSENRLPGALVVGQNHEMNSGQQFLLELLNVYVELSRSWISLIKSAWVLPGMRIKWSSAIINLQWP